MQKNEDTQGGSFLSGLTLGLFAGAASYYLLGTKDGQKLRDRLKNEWDEAKGNLPKVAKDIETQRQSFSFPNFFCKSFQVLTDGECLCGTCDRPQEVKQKKPKARKKLVKKKFQGV